MQCVVDSLREFPTDSVDGHQILNTSGCQAVQAPKVPQQAASAFGTDARDIFQQGSLASLATALAMTGDRESMRFITDLLNQV